MPVKSITLFALGGVREYREGIRGREVRILDGYCGPCYKRSHRTILSCSRLDSRVAAIHRNAAGAVMGNQLPVISNGELVGVISRSQVLQFLQTRAELKAA